MLERTTRTFDDFLQEHNLISLENKRNLRQKLIKQPLSKSDELSDEHNMTRKTRTRKLRIAVIQSGYCAVCNIPYNSVEDHIQSKKHQKLIGEDANYIALNGSLNGYLHTNSIPFLNLNGIDAIGVHDTSLDDFSPMFKRHNMSKIRSVRAASVMCDRTKPSPLSPTGSDITGHHLRSRRNINYMTPPLDDDSLQEIPDVNLLDEPVHKEFKEYRELRSSTRALAKLTEQFQDAHEEVWNSGRPKRACINKKRLSLEESSPTNCKTYYKVEVMTSKSRSSQKDQETNKYKNFLSKREDEKDKGLIVKFKKLRNSELIQLNNEATNFLFPKRDDSSEEGDSESDQHKLKHFKSIKDKNSENVTVVSEESEDCSTNFYKFKAEDEGSMDSISSMNRTKKKRRTHAEAFIMDNQKYYKFETPGSRLRYHGSYLQPIVKSPKHNGECSLKTDSIKLEEPEEKKPKVKSTKMKLDKYNFSFEKVPQHAPWYEVYQRLDNGEQRYTFFSDYFWDPMILPYQMPYLTPLDPKDCIHHYNMLMKELKEPMSRTESVCTSPEPSISTSTPSLYEPEQDEDSKMSATTLSSTCSAEELHSMERKRIRRTKAAMLQQMCSVKNPRKSPRQHASTLAILSSLIHQRKRRSRTKGLDESNPSLPLILEETTPQILSPLEIVKNEEISKVKGKTMLKRKGFIRRFKPKIDYVSIAQKIEDELDTALEGNLEDFDLDIGEENVVDFHNSKTNTAEILRLFEESKAKETEKSCRRFFNGTPGRKPGRKKKKNLTGWPKQKRGGPKRGQGKETEKEDNNSTSDSVSVNNESSDVEELIVKSSVIRQQKSECTNKQSNRVNKNKHLENKVTNEVLQPYVCVQKLDNAVITRRVCMPKRTNQKQKRILTSPRSPRNLRKPRGRWYKER